MATPKRGPLKIDLVGRDGARKIDAEYCPLTGRFHVRIGGQRYHWTATEFATRFRQWLLRQR
jgi:hypothetical protein